MHTLDDLHALLRHAKTASDFADWLRADGDRLVDAATFLGDQSSRRRAERLVRCARNSLDMFETVDDLLALRLLFFRACTGDAIGTERQFFKGPNPDDPTACKARIYLEAFDRGLVALEALWSVRVRLDGEAA